MIFSPTMYAWLFIHLPWLMCSYYTNLQSPVINICISMYLHVLVYVYVYVYKCLLVPIYVCVYLHIFVCMYKYMRVCPSIYICICVSIHTHIHKHFLNCFFKHVNNKWAVFYLFVPAQYINGGICCPFGDFYVFSLIKTNILIMFMSK